MNFETLSARAWELTKANRHYWFFGQYFSRYQIALLKTWPGTPKPNTPVYAYDPDREVFRRWYGRDTLWGFGFVLVALALNGIFLAFWKVAFPNHQVLYPLIAGVLAALGYRLIRTPLSFGLFALTDPEVNPRLASERGRYLWSRFRTDYPAVSKRILTLSMFALVPAVIYAAGLYIAFTQLLYISNTSPMLLTLALLSLAFIPPLASIPIIYTQFLVSLAYLHMQDKYPSSLPTQVSES